MRLKDLCKIKLNFPGADFWLIRKGSKNTVGKPTKEFDPVHIGIKVVQTEILVPQYLYYVMLNLYNQGVFQKYALGTINLQHIRIEDVRNIKVGP